MLLTELTGIKHLKKKTPKEILDFIASENSVGRTKLSMMGAGSNGVVLTDGKHVFKFWHRDSSYETFIKYAIANQTNPHVPKIYSKIRTLPFEIESTKDGETFKGVKYIKMEKLNHLSVSRIDVLSEKGLKTFDISTKRSNQRIDDALLHCVFSPTIESGMADIVRDMLRREGKDVNHEQLKDPLKDGFLDLFDKNFVGIAKTTRDFIINHLGEDDFPDLHSGNFMVRGPDQLVLADPIANIKDIEINAEFTSWTHQ